MSTVLITGAQGYLGRKLAEELLADSDHGVICWSHGNKSAAAMQDWRHALPGRQARRVQLVSGDLTAAFPFAQVDAHSVDKIIHAAAITRFNVAQADARAVNVQGTQKLIDFAHGCTRLDDILFLSSLYVSGRLEGPLRELRFNPTIGHCNYYEWSKWAAEECFWQAAGGLPWQILRVGTVLCDDDRGTVIQANAVHQALRLFYYGLLSLLPGKPDTPLYLATGDWITQAVLAALAQPQSQRIAHVTNGHGQAPTLHDMVRIAHQAFSQTAAFKQRRVLMPLFADRDSYRALSDTADQFSGTVVKQAMHIINPFAEQLYLHKAVQTERFNQLATAGAIDPLPDMHGLIRATCGQLANQWSQPHA